MVNLLITCELTASVNLKIHNDEMFSECRRVNMIISTLSNFKVTNND